MKGHRYLKRNSEKTVYLIFWILVFTFPILLSPARFGVDWVRVSGEWIRILPFLLMFLIHNSLIFQYFKSKKYKKYFVLAIMIALVFSIASSFNYKVFELLSLPPSPGPNDIMKILNNIFYNSLISILVIGLNDAIKITLNTFQASQEFEELQKENLQNQLSLLQHQISPHFFLNTLNNIHALIEFDKKMAQNSVIKLSKLMRVLLYENELYTLRKEIDFISDYIELMKIRVSQDIDIKFEHPDKIPELSFPPLLLISFVENSFKHGILANDRSFIHISFVIDVGFLNVRVRNSKASQSKEIEKADKIGLNNSKKRLDLIYENSYKFDVIETEKTYEVILKIPLYEDKVPGIR